MRDEEAEMGEWVSALADGQLQGEDFARAVASMASCGEDVARWHAYHVAGDVLRCADLADCGRDRAFVDRLRERLAQHQATGYAAGGTGETGPLTDGRVDAVPGVAVHAARTPSANDAAVRWKWLATAASVVALAVLGWHVSGTTGSDGAPRLAQLRPGGDGAGAGARAQSGEPPVMLRDARLDELLAAHRQLGGTSALQMPAGFLRNATFEQPGR